MANFFINRPIVAIVISILIVMIGVVIIRGLSVEQYPFLAPPNIRVTATYPGASAEAVEQSVAVPIEQEVNGVDHMIYMKSSNTSDGRMLLDVNFRSRHGSGHRQRSHAEPRVHGRGSPAGGSDPARCYGQETKSQHPDGGLSLLAEGFVRRKLPDQLLRHQSARPDCFAFPASPRLIFSAALTMACAFGSSPT